MVVVSNNRDIRLSYIVVIYKEIFYHQRKKERKKEKEFQNASMKQRLGVGA